VPQSRHSCGQTRRARHDVGVPSTDHTTPRPRRDARASGQVEPVEHLGLLVDDRLGSVQVLSAPGRRSYACGRQRISPRHRGSARPAVRGICHTPRCPCDTSPAAKAARRAWKSLCAVRAFIIPSPSARRVADAEMGCGTGVEAAFSEELPAGSASADSWRSWKNSAAAALAVYGGCGCCFPPTRRPRSAGQPMSREALDRPGEARSISAGTRVHVAGFSAAEAVVIADPGARGSWGSSSWNGQSPLSELTPPPMCDVSDDAADVGARLHLIDVCLAGPRHQSPSVMPVRLAYAERCSRRGDLVMPTSATSLTSLLCQSIA